MVSSSLRRRKLLIALAAALSSTGHARLAPGAAEPYPGGPAWDCWLCGVREPWPMARQTTGGLGQAGRLAPAFIHRRRVKSGGDSCFAAW